MFWGKINDQRGEDTLQFPFFGEGGRIRDGNSRCGRNPEDRKKKTRFGVLFVSKGKEAAIPTATSGKRGINKLKKEGEGLSGQ